MIAYTAVQSFPEEYVPLEQKLTHSWANQMAMAIYSRWYTGATLWGYSQLSFFRMMQSYAEGRQSELPYQKWYRGDGALPTSNTAGSGGAGVGMTDNLRRGYNNVNFEIKDQASVYVSIMKGIMNNTANYKVEVNSLSREATNEKVKKKFELYYGSKFINPIREAAGLSPKKYPWTPSNRQELDMYEKYHGFKLPLETALTMLGNHTLDISNWDDMFEDECDAAFQTGFMCGYVCYNKQKAIEIKYIHPSDFVTEFIQKQRNTEPTFAGHVERVRIFDIEDKLRAQGATDDNLEALARLYAGYNGNDTYSVNGQSLDFNQNNPATSRYLWRDKIVDVLHFETITEDQKRYRKYKKTDGSYGYARENPKKKVDPETKAEYYTYDPNNNKNTEKVDVKSTQVVYEGCWIIGTKWMYDYGVQKNMIRNADGTAALSYFFYAVPGKPIVERMKPLLDACQMGWIKQQVMRTEATPRGFLTDLGLISNMDFGFGVLSPLEVMRIRKETGNMFVNTTAMMIQNRMNPASSMVELDGGMGPQQQEWLLDEQQLDKAIRVVTGITDAVSAGGGADLVGLGEQQMQATDNALYSVRKGLKRLKEKAYQRAISKIRVCIEYDPDCQKYYREVIGDQLVDSILMYKDLTLNQIGITMRAAPSPQRKMTIMELAKQALAVGKNGEPSIEYEDFLFIEDSIENGYVELAAWYLSVAKQKTRERQMNEAMQLSKDNAQNQQAAAQAAEEAAMQAKQVITQLEGQKEMGVQTNEYKLKMALANLEAANQRKAAADQFNYDLILQAQKGKQETDKNTAA